MATDVVREIICSLSSCADRHARKVISTSWQSTRDTPTSSPKRKGLSLFSPCGLDPPRVESSTPCVGKTGFPPNFPHPARFRIRVHSHSTGKPLKPGLFTGLPTLPNPTLKGSQLKALSPHLPTIPSQTNCIAQLRSLFTNTSGLFVSPSITCPLSASQRPSPQTS